MFCVKETFCGNIASFRWSSAGAAERKKAETERAGSIPGHYRSALPPGRGGEDQYSHVDIVRAGGLLWRHHGLFAGTQRPAGVTRDGPPNGGQEGLAPAKGLVQPGCTPHFLFRLAEKKTGRARSKRKGRLGALRCSGPPRATGVGVSVQAPILPDLRARYGLLRFL